MYCLVVANHEYDGASTKKKKLTQTEEGAMNGSNDTHYGIEIQVVTLELTYIHMCEAFAMYSCHYLCMTTNLRNYEWLATQRYLSILPA